MNITVEALVGKWRLLSFDIAPLGGELAAWRGGSTGSLQYTADGRMSVKIVGRNEPEHGEPDDANIIKYSGTFTLDKDGRTIRHQVEMANDTTRQNKEMVRRLHFLEKNKILLTGERLGKQFALVWEKCE